MNILQLTKNKYKLEKKPGYDIVNLSYPGFFGMRILYGGYTFPLQGVRILLRKEAGNGKDLIRLPWQDLPGMLKSLKSSHKPRF